MKLLPANRIVLISQGGLGNQLFVWNAAHVALQANVKRVYILHLSGKAKKDDRQFELQHLQLKCSHAISVIQSSFFNRFFRFIDSGLSRTLNLKKLIRMLDLSPEQGVHVQQFEEFSIFRGYFQNSESVNKGIEIWMHELTSANQHQRKKSGFSSAIHGKYLAFHIRRGDYVDNASTLGVISLNYYEQFRIKTMPLYVSSDAAEIRAAFPDSISLWDNTNQAPAGPWSDFIALSESAILVTANSTFSWWAGVLVLRNGGRVIAPSPWNKVMTLSDNYLKWEGFEYASSLFE